MNKQLIQLEVMLNLQDQLNTKVNFKWKEANNNWLRACWVECAELMDHVGYKWWKKQTPNILQAQIELVDIFHFTLSYILQSDISSRGVADNLLASATFEKEDNYQTAVDNLHKAFTLELPISLMLKRFFICCNTLDLSFDKLYEMYIAKNVLNIFRQDNGYKEGTYIKQWPSPLIADSTVEDNVYLEMFLAESETQAVLAGAPEKFFDYLYNKLTKNYPS